MSKESARDELARVIVAAYGEDAEVECPCEQDWELTDAILAAGYRKPRTITTVEELDALPKGTVIHSDEAGVFERGVPYWRESGSTFVMPSEDIALPVTVLHELEPTA